MTQATPSNYWMSNTALFITLNAMGDVNKLQAYSVPGAVIMCYIKGVSGLEYDNGHNYKRWSLSLYPTVLSDSTAKYIYVAIPRPTATTVDTSSALVVFPSEVIDLYGQNEAGDQIGSEEYYYINTEGVIAASVDADGNAINRVWTKAMNFGLLSTDEAFNSNTDGWWEYDSTQDAIRFTKKILSAVFGELTATTATITNLILGNDTFTGKAAYTALTDTSESTIVTPKFLLDRETDVEQKYLRKDTDDTTTHKLTLDAVDVKGIMKAFSLLQSDGFVDDMSTGKGWGVDANGNMQVESLEVRSALRVLELVYNRLSAEESEYVFTEAGTIESVTVSGSSYICKIKKRSDTDFHAFHKGDILRGIVNDLANLGGGTYFTSWVLVTDTDTTNNTITVSKYADSDVPSGTNYAPAEMMVLQRWGNNVEPSEESHDNEDYASFITQKSDGTWINDRQSCWYLSSIEKRIAILDGVNQPKLTNSNYAAFFGLPYNIDTFLGHTLDSTQPYLYVRGAFLQDVYRIDYKGNQIKEERYRGIWDEDTSTGSDPYIVTDTTYDTVYYGNAKYQCAGAVGVAVTAVPGEDDTKWVKLMEAKDGNSLDIKGTALSYEYGDGTLEDEVYSQGYHLICDLSESPSGFVLIADGSSTYRTLVDKGSIIMAVKGDCYSIDGELYCYDEEYDDWTDIGGIKGEKGDKGDDAVLYSLVPDYTYIKIGSDGSTRTPSGNINIKLYKTVGSTTTEMTMSSGAYDNKYYLKFSIDGADKWTRRATGVLYSYQYNTATSSVRLQVVNKSDATDILAQITIPVISDALAPQIDAATGCWKINGEVTEYTAIGDDGHTPYIQDGYWWEWDVDKGAYQQTTIKAIGEDAVIYELVSDVDSVTFTWNSETSSYDISIEDNVNVKLYKISGTARTEIEWDEDSKEYKDGNDYLVLQFRRDTNDFGDKSAPYATVSSISKCTSVYSFRVVTDDTSKTVLCTKDIPVIFGGKAGTDGKDGKDGTDGVDGADAKMLTLSADRTVVACDNNYIPQDTTAITVTAGLINISGTTQWTVKANGTALGTSYYSISGNILTLRVAAFSVQANAVIEVTAGVTYNNITYQQTMRFGRVCNGAPGEAVNGKDAKPLRGPLKWTEGATYQGGATTDMYQDIVYIDGTKEMYLCHWTHVASADNSPKTHQSTSEWSESVPWSSSDWVDFTATSVLFAERGSIKNADIDECTITGTITETMVTDLDTMTADCATEVLPTDAHATFQIVDIDKGGSVFIPTEIEEDGHTSLGGSCALLNRNKLFLLPMYNDVTLTETLDDLTTVRSFVVPKYQREGTQLTISVGVPPVDIAGWALQKDYIGKSTNLIYSVYCNSVVICADALMFASYDSSKKYGQARDVTGAFLYGDSTFKHGRFSCNGAFGRFLLLMPGQVLKLVSMVEEIYGEKCLVWYVVNASEFTSIACKVKSTTVTGAEHTDEFLSDGYLDPTDDLETDAHWRDNLFAHKSLDLSLTVADGQALPDICMTMEREDNNISMGYYE